MDDFTATIKSLQILAKLSHDDRVSLVEHTTGLTKIVMGLKKRERNLLITHLLEQTPSTQLGMADKVSEIIGEKPYTPPSPPSS